jgi:hypothetical protein
MWEWWWTRAQCCSLFYLRVLRLSPVSITPTMTVPCQYHSNNACPLSVSLQQWLSPVSITTTMSVPCQYHSNNDCPMSVSLQQWLSLSRSLQQCLSSVSITPTMTVPCQYHSNNDCPLSVSLQQCLPLSISLQKCDCNSCACAYQWSLNKLSLTDNNIVTQLTYSFLCEDRFTSRWHESLAADSRTEPLFSSHF